jgi:hypothetical protein
MRKIADVLGQDLDLVGIFEEPTDGSHLDGALIRQGLEIAPLTAGLAAVLPANDDEATPGRHRQSRPFPVVRKTAARRRHVLLVVPDARGDSRRIIAETGAWRGDRFATLMRCGRFAGDVARRNRKRWRLPLWPSRLKSLGRADLPPLPSLCMHDGAHSDLDERQSAFDTK